LLPKPQNPVYLIIKYGKRIAAGGSNPKNTPG